MDIKWNLIWNVYLPILIGLIFIIISIYQFFNKFLITKGLEQGFYFIFMTGFFILALICFIYAYNYKEKK